MTGVAALLWVVVGAAVQGQSATVDRLRALAERGSDSALAAAVRDSPEDARLAMHWFLERAVATDSEAVARAQLASAYRLARLYADTWRDSFPLRVVARFEAWSADERAAKITLDSLRRVGNIAFGRSGASAAVPLWRESLRRAAALGDTAGMAAALGNIGAAFYRSDELDSAETYLERSRRLAEAAGDGRTALNALGTLGSVSKDRGDLRRAQELYSRVLLLRQEIGDVRGMAADRNNLGLIAEQLGDLEEARRGYEAALRLSRRYGLAEPEAVSLVNLGNVASLEADYAAAVERYHEALAIYRRMGNRVDAAFVLHNLGLLELRRGDYARASARLAEALAIYERTGPIAEAVEVRRDLAAVSAAMGDLQGALSELRRADRSAGRATPGLLGRLALARADLAVQFNRYAEADLEYAQAARLYRRAGDQAGEAEAHQGRGFLLLVREDYAQAETVLVQAARIEQLSGDPRPAALTGLLIAYAERQRGDTAAARRRLVQALDSLRALGDVVGAAAALGAMGDVEAEAGMAAAAESLYGVGLARLGTRPAPTVAWQLHAGLGGALRSRGALAEAAREFRAAIAEIERVSGALGLEERRAEYLADKWDVYTELALVERARGRTGAAFEASERLRARQMLDLLARGRVAWTAEGSDSLGTREQDLRRQMAELTRRLEAGEASEVGLRGADPEGRGSTAAQEALARAQERYGELLLEVRESRPDYATLVSGETVEWREVASRLAPGEVLLEYLLGDSTSLVFVVRPESVAVLDLNVGRHALATLVDFARGTMTRPERGNGGARAAWRAPLRRLFDYLITPVEAAGLLDGTHRLIIAPHAELHYIPFGALISRGDRDRFLIERYDVSYVPSASVWVRLSERPPAPPAGGVLALAPQAGALPGSRAEVEAIRGIYGERATVLTGAAASEAALRSAAPGRGVVHLATYGVLNKPNPLFSYVALSPGGEDDGRLEVHEVFGLALNVRLVVLSACQTALGSGALADVPAGDDWVGLVQAFLYSGASHVMATLWPVEDVATARLMERFYRALEAGRSEGAALAQAQRQTLHDAQTAHPFYWAGFVVSGGR